MKLIGIDANGDQGLTFRFDDGGVRRKWEFELASLAEFLALVLEGRLRDSEKLELPVVEVAITGHAGKPARLDVILPKIEMTMPLSDEQLVALRDAINRRLPARSDGQKGSLATTSHLRIVSDRRQAPTVAADNGHEQPET